MNPDSEIEYEIPSIVRVHKSGRVERLQGTETVPASPSGEPAASGVASKDVVLDSAANISARLYLPAAAAAADPSKKLPVVVFFHGGAFMIHTAASPIYHRYAASLAAAAPAVVVSVNYRLAPEHPVPAAYEDAFAALKAVVASCRPGGAEPWLAAHGDASRVVLAGDSAGANMAHRTAIRLHKERNIEGYGDKVSGVALLHSYFWGREPVGGEPKDAAVRGGLDRVWEVACGGQFGLDHPYINPSPEEWRQLGCRRVLVATAELCWFVERSRAYAEGVRACGWDGELQFYETKGDGHVYFLFTPDGDSAAKELAVVADFIRSTNEGLSLSEIAIRNALYWPDGKRKYSSRSNPDEDHMGLLVQALLDKYNEENMLSGDCAYQVENVVSFQEVYEGKAGWYYHLNCTRKTKVGVDNLFFAEVSKMKRGQLEEFELTCLHMLESVDNGILC